MPKITFDTAVTQHAAATQRLNTVHLKMATGRRDAAGVMEDAANFSVAARFDAKVHRMDAALSNVGNSMSFLQTQDGTLETVSRSLNRMGELAILAQDATKSDADRALYTEEFNQLKAGLSETTQATFNGVKMFSSEPKTVTVDENAKMAELPAVDLEAAASEVVAEGTDLSTLENAAAALASVKEALNDVSTERAEIGAAQSRLEAASDQIIETRSAIGAASSRITDVDYAKAATEKSAAQVQLQLATAVLAHKSVSPEAALLLTF